MGNLKNRWDAWKGLSSSTVKLIAAVTMLIDHAGAGIIGRYLSQAGIMEALGSSDIAVMEQWMDQNAVLYYTYDIMRDIGRLAFPIYCFFLVEGLKYTRNVWKYAGRLLLFALISEIPFDLLFNGAILEFKSQNVFFTLAAGLAVIAGMKKVEESQLDKWKTILLNLLLFGAGCLLTEVMATDYSYLGVMCITIIYVFSANRKTELIAGAASFWWELPVAPLAFLILAMYKNQRGWKLKYFFYAFYPAHLLLLTLIAWLLGIWQYQAL